jgi:TatD DNase family protein
MSSEDLIRRIPQDRVLFETDHPYGDRRSAQPRRPGNAKEVEMRIGARWAVSRYAARAVAWQNLDRLVQELQLGHFFARSWRATFEEVRQFNPATDSLDAK